MSSENSGISAATASAQHVISYLAFTPDDGDVRGVASVTAIVTADGEHHVPFAELAKIPGFVEGDVIREHDGDPAVWLLGPGTDAPGHDAWCVEHIDDSGDGRSLCWGERTEIRDTSVHLTRTTGSAARVWYSTEFHDGGEELTPVQARERAAELRQVAARLDVLADVAEAGSAVSK